MKKLNFENPAYEWLIYRNDNFTVQVRSWVDSNKHHWNVYANIFDTHPFFNEMTKVLDLHFHGGVTYEQRITHTPAQGIKYSWQKSYETLKVGSDYAHLHDDWFATQDPIFGIPSEIKSDATQLVNQLLNLTINSEVEQ